MPVRRRTLALAILALTAACALVVARFGFGVDLSLSAERLASRDWFGTMTARHPAASAALFFAFTLACCSAGLSRLALSALAGVVFGAYAGVAIALPATVLGSWIVYMFGRLAGVERVRNLIGTRARYFVDLPGKIGWPDVMFARQIPLPAPVINLLLAVAGTRTVPFFIGTAVGYLPGTLIAVFLGHGASSAGGGDRAGFYTAMGAAAFTALVALLLRFLLRRSPWQD